jgi:biotin carboxyl carrier protein
MKMEYTMRAPRNGVVAEVRTAVGEQVDEGATLLTLQPKKP